MKLNFEDFYQDYLDTLAAFNLAQGTIYNDSITIAPVKGQPYANKMAAILASRAFEIENNPETIEKMKDYSKRLPEGSLEKKELDWRLKQLAKTEHIPPEVYGKYAKTKSDSEMIWRQAKNASDYSMFKPYFKDLMEQTLEILKYDPAYDGTNSYDLQLDSYEPGMNQEKYDAFFEVIKEELPPLIKEIAEKGRHIDDSLMDQEYDVKKQEEFMDVIMDYLKADPERVYLSTTEHPFTNFLSPNDVRITTHYYPKRFISAILSTVHEYGHALYGLQMDADFEGTMFKSGVGSAAHESQSRLLENHIGRSLPFWQANYDKLIEVFPQFASISPEELTDMINVSKNGLIRIEADELTYPLHILIRYELEKQIANGTADFDALPKAWADKYEQYLGIRPETDRDGILQDVHWATGYLGYFPTYALGSAMAAQIYEAMASELDVETLLKNNQFDVIANWLNEHVHQFAGTKTMMEITEEVSKKPFDPHIYTSYLKDKYRKLYQLD